MHHPAAHLVDHAAHPPRVPAAVGDLSKADLEGKVVFVRADLNVSGFGVLCKAPRLSLRLSSAPHPRGSARLPAGVGFMHVCASWREVQFCTQRRAFTLAFCFVLPPLQVPLDGDLNISDDTRIRAAVPTLKYLVDNGAKVSSREYTVQSAFF